MTECDLQPVCCWGQSFKTCSPSGQAFASACNLCVESESQSSKQCTRAQTCAMNRSMQAGKRRKLLLILSTTCKMYNSQPFIPEVMVSSDSESEAVKGGHSCEMRLRYPQSQLPPQLPGVNTASGMPQQMPLEALLQEQACNPSG